MKHPILPPLRRATPFSEKFGPDVACFGRGRKPEPPPLGYLPHILFGLASAFLVSLMLCLVGLFPKVGEVSAEGGRIYSADVMCHYADVHTGDRLWGFDTHAVEEQMKDYMPLLISARVKKHLNGDVSIRAVEYEKLYYTCHNRNYYIFTTDEFRVLCALPDDTEAKRVGAVYIGLPESARVRVGETISFINLPYTSESQADNWSDYEVETDVPEKENAYVAEFIEALMSSELAPRVRGMDLSDRYALYFILDGRIRVSVGSMEELSVKLSMAHRALAEREAEGVYSDELPLSVDVSDPVRLIFRASLDVHIPVWG